MKWYPIVVAAIGLVSSVAFGHGVPITITADQDSLAVASLIEPAVLQDDGFEIFTTDPGFGVALARTAPPSGMELGIQVTSGLLFWDGAEVVETASVLLLEAPEFDSLGNANETSVEAYEIAADSGPQAGMTWSTYPGGGFWDAHGFYSLTQSESAPAAGLYAVELQIVDQTGRLEPTAPFLLPLLFDPSGSFSGNEIFAGREALEAALLVGMAGDYDLSGSVDGADYDRWRATYGSSVELDADGNHDQFVNAADYTIWRDSLVAPSFAIPEPSHAALLVLMLAGRTTLREFINFN